MVEGREGADVYRVLAHHDQQLGSLTTEVATIKVSLSEHGAILQEIRGALGDLKGSRGPGIGAIIKGVAGGGAIVAMSAAAITVLVTSFVAPDVTKLKTEGARTERYIEHQEASERKELTDYRRKEAARIDRSLDAMASSISELKARSGWTSHVEPARK